MERVRQGFSAVLAGMLIGMGGTVFLSQANPVVGSFLFAIGLFTILAFQLHLYTGKIGYLPLQQPEYLIELAITWVGNLVGTGITAMLVKYSRIGVGLIERVTPIVEIKMADGFRSIFFLSIFCGMLMFIAADTYRNLQGSTLRAIGVFVPVMVFILSGFEHSIANMFYFGASGIINMDSIIYLAVVIAGNSVGGMAMPILNILGKGEPKNA